jgi:hypothetical protein
MEVAIQVLEPFEIPFRPPKGHHDPVDRPSDETGIVLQPRSRKHLLDGRNGQKAGALKEGVPLQVLRLELGTLGGTQQPPVERGGRGHVYCGLGRILGGVAECRCRNEKGIGGRGAKDGNRDRKCSSDSKKTKRKHHRRYSCSESFCFGIVLAMQ